ncbi:hypothetical protein Tco_0467792 [Tanacetum coccineum]
MIIDINNWSSPVHQEFQKILKDEIAPIVNQVDARVQNFEIQLLKEATKFVRDFKSLAKEAVESLDKNKIHLQTELDRTKEKLETCIIKKEKEYVVLWNNWYKNVKNVNMTRFRTIKPIMICNIKSNTLNLKGTSRNTQCVSNTLDPLSQKLDDEYSLHTVPKYQESKVVKNDKVISPRMSRMNPLKNSRIDNFVPNKHAKASVRTKPITVSQPHVITKKDVNSNTNGLPSTIVESTTKTRRPQPRSNPKNGRIPSASKSSCLSNNLKKKELHKEFTVVLKLQTIVICM